MNNHNYKFLNRCKIKEKGLKQHIHILGKARKINKINKINSHHLDNLNLAKNQSKNLKKGIVLIHLMFQKNLSVVLCKAL